MYETVKPSDLWTALQPLVPANSLPASTTLNDVIINWIDLAGYPLVTVNKIGNDVLLSQVR